MVFAIANKDARYVLPLVSVFAVVSTSWIGALRGLAQGVAVGLVAVLSAGTILANLFVWTPPDLRDWKIEDAAARIAERLNDGEGGLPILVVPNTWWTSFREQAGSLKAKLMLGGPGPGTIGGS